MAKKVVLKTHAEPVYYTLIGISCHMMDYRFMHLLCKKLEVDFTKEDDLLIHFPNAEQTVGFSFYSGHDEEQRNSYYLISNFNQENVLIPEFRHLDFMMLIDGDVKRKKNDELLSVIRSIPKVIAAFEIKSNDMKTPASFFTDVEMHIAQIHKVKKQKRQKTV